MSINRLWRIKKNGIFINWKKFVAILREKTINVKNIENEKNIKTFV